MSHDVTLFGFSLWLRLIFHSHQMDEQGRESYGTFSIEEAKHPQTILDYELNEGHRAPPKGAPQHKH